MRISLGVQPALRGVSWVIKSRLVTLGRFVVRALRISASTIAVVALLRQQWLPAGCFALAWMLILVAPRVFPILIEAPLPPVTPTD